MVNIGERRARARARHRRDIENLDIILMTCYIEFRFSLCNGVCYAREGLNEVGGGDRSNMRWDIFDTCISVLVVPTMVKNNHRTEAIDAFFCMQQRIKEDDVIGFSICSSGQFCDVIPNIPAQGVKRERKNIDA